MRPVMTAFIRCEGGVNHRIEVPMLASIIVALVILAALANAFRGGHRGDLITSRPYNNRYNAASGARDQY
jgi:hypothetical protein